MLKSDELTDPTSCLNRARDDERLFVLLERDAAAPAAIYAWLAERVRLGKNHPRDAQALEAISCARAMEVARSAAPPVLTFPWRRRRPRVALDCDGILSDFIGGALPVVQQTTGRTYVHADVTAFDFCAVLGLTVDERRAVMHRIATWQGFAAGLQLLPGALAGVEAIRAIAELRIATSPWAKSPTWAHDRAAWLWRELRIPEEHVISSNDKTWIEADVFADDRSKNVAAWIADHPSGVGVFWRTRHNIDEQVPPGAILVDGPHPWVKFIDIVRARAGVTHQQELALEKQHG